MAMSSRERVRRDASIVASRARGRPWAAIAEEHGLTARQAKRIFAVWRADGEGSDWIDPIAEVRSTLDLMRQAIADMATIEEDPDNDAAHIGATRLKVEAALKRFDLMQALGLLPLDLRMVDGRLEQARVLEEFAALARDYDVPDAYLDACTRLAEREMTRARRPETLLKELVSA